MKEAHRQRGTIDYAREDDCDGRCETVYVGIDFDGSFQAFGGFMLQEHRAAWVSDLCALFGVSRLEELKGKQCWALRSFSGWDETIEGLESMDGKRLTATDFFRRHLGRPVENRLARRREELQSSIAAYARQIDDATRRIVRLEADYVEWSPLTSGTPKDGSR